jgi:membrane protease YdiL (CAAX protease family)
VTALDVGAIRARITLAPVRVAIGYLAAIGLAEAILIQGGLFAGAICHGLVLVALVGHRLMARRAGYRGLLLALALLPLLRLLGLALPLAETPPLVWQAMVGVPFLLAAFLVARTERLDPRLIGISRRMDPLVQLTAALAGVPLGLLGWLALRPAPLFPEPDVVAIALTILVMTVFVAIGEEVVFRGLLQGMALVATGSSTGAVAISATAYGLLFVPTLSPAFVLVMVLIGMLFGAVVEATGSLLGVIAGHALLIIGMAVIWPVVLGGL